MGKKKMYNLKEHERYEKRVDIFRSVQQSPSHAGSAVAAAAAKIIVMKKGGGGGFINQSYLSSDMSLEQAIRTPDERKGNPLFVSDDPVWMTRASFSPSPPPTRRPLSPPSSPLDVPTDDEAVAAQEAKAADAFANSSQQKFPLTTTPPPKQPQLSHPITLPITRFPSKAEFYPPFETEKSIKLNDKGKRNRKFLISCLFASMLLAIVGLIIVLVVFFKLNSDAQMNSKSSPVGPTLPPSQGSIINFFLS